MVIALERNRIEGHKRHKSSNRCDAKEWRMHLATEYKDISLGNLELAHGIHELFGIHDENIRFIENELSVSILNRDNTLRIVGKREDIEWAEKLISNLLKIIDKNGKLTKQDLNYNIQMIKDNPKASVEDLLNEVLCMTHRGKPIKPKTLGQLRYMEALERNDIVFGVGPAGTGKTYLAVAKAVSALKKGQVNKLIITRPAVEAGESLGFLPGDLQDKIDPYLRPINDALFDILGAEQFMSLKEKGIIEIAPLAYMRGRTLDAAYVILDEAQNTTKEQMKMFLTRIGYGSKAIITGDITQVDLPRGKKSGLVQAINILKGIKGITFIQFEKQDVVRHRLVQQIIEAYEKIEKNEG